MLNLAVIQGGIHNIRHALIILEQPLIQSKDNGSPAPRRIGFSSYDLPDSIGTMTHHAKPAGPDGFIPFLFTQKHCCYLSLKLFLNFTAESAESAERTFLFICLRQKIYKELIYLKGENTNRISTEPCISAIEFVFCQQGLSLFICHPFCPPVFLED
jgi:hypothetical protein